MTQTNAQKTAVQVSRTEQPIGNGEGEVHVHFHHQLAVVMRCMMSAQRIHQRAMAHEGVFIDMTTEVHKLTH